MAKKIDDVHGPDDGDLDDELEAAGLSITDAGVDDDLDRDLSQDLDDDLDEDDDDEDDDAGVEPADKAKGSRKSKGADDEDEDEDDDEVEDDLDKILDERLHPDRADAEEDEEDDEGPSGTTMLANATEEEVILCGECFTSVRSSQLDMRGGDPACPNCGLPISS